MNWENTYNQSWPSLFRTIFSIPDPAPEDLLRRAQRAYAREKFTDCLHWAGRAVASDRRLEESPEMLMLQGKAYYSLQQFQAAANKFGSAIEENPALAEGHLLLARSFRELGRTDEALEALGAGIRQVHGAGAARLHLEQGRLMQALGRWRDALDDYAQALNADHRLVEAYACRAILRAEQGFRREALNDCSEALRLEPRSALAHYAYGCVYRRLGRLKAARQHLEQAYALDAGNPQINYLLAEVLIATGDQDPAMTLLRQTLEEDAGSREARELKARIYRQWGHRAAGSEPAAGASSPVTPYETPPKAEPRKQVRVDHTIYRKVDEPPLFLHYEWLSANMQADKLGHTRRALTYFVALTRQFPEIARQVGVKGKVNVFFVIEKDGSVSHIQARSRLDFGCKEEAVRIFEKMNEMGLRWEPARIRNRPVRMAFQWLVEFTPKC